MVQKIGKTTSRETEGRRQHIKLTFPKINGLTNHKLRYSEAILSMPLLSLPLFQGINKIIVIFFSIQNHKPMNHRIGAMSFLNENVFNK